MTKIYISLACGILSFLTSLLVSHIIAKIVAKQVAKEVFEAHRPELIRAIRGRNSAKSGPSNGSDA